MALPRLETVLNKISSMSTYFVGQPATAKSYFDHDVNEVKDYINDTLVPEIEETFETKENIATNRKLSETGNFTGTWQGYSPVETDPGIQAIVNEHTSQLDDIEMEMADIALQVGKIDVVYEDPTSPATGQMWLYLDLYSVNLTTNSANASASSLTTGFPASLAFDGIGKGSADDYTKSYVSQSFTTTEQTEWLKYTFGSDTPIRKVSLWTKWPSSRDETIQIQYSDNDSTWTNAGSPIAITVSATNLKTDFILPDVGSHVYWRLLFSLVSLSSQAVADEVEMYAYA